MATPALRRMIVIKRLLVLLILITALHPQLASGSKHAWGFGGIPHFRRVLRERILSSLEKHFFSNPEHIYIRMTVDSAGQVYFSEEPGQTVDLTPKVKTGAHASTQPKDLHLREYNVNHEEDVTYSIWEATKRLNGTKGQPVLVGDGSNGVREVEFPAGTPLEHSQLAEQAFSLIFLPATDGDSQAYVTGLGESSILFIPDGTKNDDGRPRFDLAQNSETIDIDPNLIDPLKKLLATYANFGDSQLQSFTEDGTQEIETIW